MSITMASYTTIIKLIVFSFVILLLSSCALKAIPSQYTPVKDGFENVELDKLGNGKVLIYNGADILHKMDNTARLNIWIDNNSLGQLKASEYVIIDLREGNYNFKVQHLDMVNIRSNHKVEIDSKIKVIKIKPTITSNKLEIINELPQNFNKFSYTNKI
ncbi:hypothetical protein [Flavobacterium sp. KACC 22761]|uniref:hypothetical protein n=1 Tax=Flavobacterium sp. KACC 22761 TaxID=3092665 RepID=UPI002A7519EB|nr:hypothetical protein [Flavobacterium sp. KACC 22761]WPO80241.1 hypothetical protein SCB73_07615 [Flavobacterium sp. KACC 22761]